MKVTAIDIHEIQLEYVDWIAHQLNHYYGPSRRTIYEVQTDEGLVGLGESGTYRAAGDHRPVHRHQPLRLDGRRDLPGSGHSDVRPDGQSRRRSRSTS